MLCVVAASRLQRDEGSRVRDRLHSLLGMDTVLLTEPSEVKVDDGLILVPATGGTERILAYAIESTSGPIMLWALPGNSLASALEVYSVYRDRVLFVHSSLGGGIERVARFVGLCGLLNSRIRVGIVGGISEWLLTSSREDAERLGFEVVDVGLEELLRYGTDVEGLGKALEEIVRKYGLSAVTVKCFDLLEHGTTACLPMAKLSVPAGCEGDVGALVTMVVSSRISGRPSWMANVCRLDPLVLAHCTVPLSMVRDYELTTHAESGKGVAVRGRMKEGVVTVSRYGRGRMLIGLGRIVRNLRERGLCRTQVELEPFFDLEEFVENCLGNHVVLTYGDITRELSYFCRLKGVEPIVLRPYRLHHTSGAD